MAWIGWGTLQINGNWSWRSIALLQCLPAVIQLGGIYWVPESPRFLIFRNKPEKALEMLAYYHAGGDVSDATVQVRTPGVLHFITAHSSRILTLHE